MRSQVTMMWNNALHHHTIFIYLFIQIIESLIAFLSLHDMSLKKN
jgi:hypothetical protein